MHDERQPVVEKDEDVFPAPARLKESRAAQTGREIFGRRIGHQFGAQQLGGHDFTSDNGTAQGARSKFNFR
jgi:hypothetical protein